MKCDKFSKREIAAMARLGFAVADDAESAQLHQGGDGETSIDLIRPHGEYNFTMTITLSNGVVLTAQMRPAALFNSVELLDG